MCKALHQARFLIDKAPLYHRTGARTRSERALWNRVEGLSWMVAVVVVVVVVVLVVVVVVVVVVQGYLAHKKQHPPLGPP